MEVDYLYDEKDRILGVTQADREIRYSYGEFDDLRALHHNGFSYEYEYDAFGNVTRILLAGQEICRNEYNPNNGSHVRSLYPDGTDTGKTYDGKEITYDVFGCPIDYMGRTMDWDIYGGLTSVTGNGDTVTYTYMGDGQRRSKTVNGVTTTYHYNNGMLLSESTGEESLRFVTIYRNCK